MSLSEASRWHAVGLLLVASQHDNMIPMDLRWIRSEIKAKAPIDFTALIASEMLELCEHNAIPEKETEKRREETEKKKGAATAASHGRKRKTSPNDNNFSHAFMEAWTTYPKRPNNPKKAAWRQWQGRLREGTAEDSLLAATRNYGAWIKLENKEPQFTLQARTFWGPNGRWEEYEKEVPEASGKKTSAQVAPKANRTDEEYLDLPEWQKRKNESRRKD